MLGIVDVARLFNECLFIFSINKATCTSMIGDPLRDYIRSSEIDSTWEILP